MNVLRALSLAAVGGLAAGCTLSFTTVGEGAGVPISELRTVGAFRGLRVEGGLEVTVQAGETHPLVTVHGDDNLLVHVLVEVRGESLFVAVERGYRLNPAPRVEVHAPRLEFLKQLGSGSITVRGIEGPRFELSTAGSGEVFATGRVGRLDVDQIGSGDVNLFDLVAEEVQIDSTGSGDAEVCARRRLEVSLVGSGDVVYAGRPQLSRKTVGSGDVRRVGD